MNFKDEMRDDGWCDDGCPHLQLLRDVWLDLVVVVLKVTDPVNKMWTLRAEVSPPYGVFGLVLKLFVQQIW